MFKSVRDIVFLILACSIAIDIVYPVVISPFRQNDPEKEIKLKMFDLVEVIAGGVLGYMVGMGKGGSGDSPKQESEEDTKDDNKV